MVMENSTPKTPKTANIMAGFPAFPTVYTEKDTQLLANLQTQAKQQQEIYTQNFTPQAWANKSAIERSGMDFVSGAPSILTNLLPTGSLGMTPQEADYTIQQTESQISEILRKQRLSTRLPDIVDFMALSAMSGTLTGEEANLYDLIPELNPSYSGVNKLELNDAERKWFTDYATALGQAKASGDTQALMDLYDNFQTRLTYDQSMADVQADMPTVDPLYILSTVALSRDAERIKEALKLAYPPKVADEEAGFEDYLWESVKTQLAAYTNPETGLPYTSTGTRGGDSLLLTRLSGDPNLASTTVLLTSNDGIPYEIVEKMDGFYDTTGTVRIANKDANGEWVSLQDWELFELDYYQDPTDIYKRLDALVVLGGMDLTGITVNDIEAATGLG
jgi:hypothetical protein